MVLYNIARKQGGTNREILTLSAPVLLCGAVKPSPHANSFVGVHGVPQVDDHRGCSLTGSSLWLEEPVNAQNLKSPHAILLDPLPHLPCFELRGGCVHDDRP